MTKQHLFIIDQARAKRAADVAADVFDSLSDPIDTVDMTLLVAAMLICTHRHIGGGDVESRLGSVRQMCAYVEEVGALIPNREPRS